MHSRHLSCLRSAIRQVARMAKRHTLDTTQLQSIICRLQELVAANSGENTFMEVFKLLIAKITSEDLGTDWKICCDTSASAVAVTEVQSLLAKANQRWPQIAGEFPESKLGAAHLPVCAAVLMHTNIRKCGLDALDHAFEFLTSSKSKGALGQYFTPRHVIDACVRLARPSSFDTILDPACGSGGFLFHAWSYVECNSAKKPTSSQFWGLDFDERAVSVARAMMLLSGADEARLLRLNSLLKPSQSLLPRINQTLNELTVEDLMSLYGVKRGFDLILTNPPFAGEIVESDMLAAYDNSRGLKRVERDALFLERCINLLSAEGKLVIILPHNKFGGKSHRPLREWLLKNARVFGVIGLDRHAFAPHTNQKTNILLCKRRKSPLKQIPSNEEIFFGVSEKTGRDSSGKELIKPGCVGFEGASWERVDHDLDELVTAFHDFTEKHKLNW